VKLARIGSVFPSLDVLPRGVGRLWTRQRGWRAAELNLRRCLLNIPTSLRANIQALKLPRFGGHPKTRDNAQGVSHGETKSTKEVQSGFKAKAVRLCRAGNRSITQVAQDLDLTESALRNWLKQ